MNAKELYQEYMHRYGHMPISFEVVRDFLGTHKHLANADKDTVLDHLYDWVGSQGLYEDGAEEEW